jgi:hypothetical protein
MNGEATITVQEKYVFVDVKGEPLSPEEIQSTLSKAAKQAVESQLNIIIHRELPVKQKASIINFFYYAEFMSSSVFRNKLALVFPREMHYDNLDFFVTAAKNRGVRLELFSSMEEALDWID